MEYNPKSEIGYQLKTKKGENKDLIKYKPKLSSIELSVESYSAMRYHGQ